MLNFIERIVIVMSFDKHMGKDWRKPFTGAKSIDHSCRNHGSCEYCKNKRTWFDTKHRRAAELKINEYWEDKYSTD